MSDQTINITQGDTITLQLPDGRAGYLWYHTCEHCSSLDVWTTRGNEVEDISARTGDTTRAPIGVMAWRNGDRATLTDKAGESWEATEGSHGWPAAATVSLVWEDK